MIANICFIGVSITLLILAVLVLYSDYKIHTDIVERQKDIDNKLEVLSNLFQKDEEIKETKENKESEKSEESKEPEKSEDTIFGLVDDLLSGKRSMEDDSE